MVCDKKKLGNDLSEAHFVYEIFLSCFFEDSPLVFGFWYFGYDMFMSGCLCLSYLEFAELLGWIDQCFHQI